MGSDLHSVIGDLLIAIVLNEDIGPGFGLIGEGDDPAVIDQIRVELASLGAAEVLIGRHTEVAILPRY